MRAPWLQEPETQPFWSLFALGGSIFLTAYMAASPTVFVLESEGPCDSSDPHSIRCDYRPYAFVPFVHFMGTGHLGGYIVGIVATAAEGVGVILAIIGLAVQRPVRRGDAAVELDLAPPGADVGLGVRARF